MGLVFAVYNQSELTVYHTAMIKSIIRNIRVFLAFLFQSTEISERVELLCLNFLHPEGVFMTLERETGKLYFQITGRAYLSHRIVTSGFKIVVYKGDVSLFDPDGNAVRLSVIEERALLRSSMSWLQVAPAGQMNFAV